MYNKKTLSKATAELDKAKAPKKPKDIITDPMGQWKYPGLPTRIPNNGSNDLPITMDGVYRPLLAIASTGEKKVMHPKENHTFRGAKYVDEYPMKKGGTNKSKSGTITNVKQNPDGGRRVQVKTKDGKYYEKVIPMDYWEKLDQTKEAHNLQNTHEKALNYTGVAAYPASVISSIADFRDGKYTEGSLGLIPFVGRNSKLAKTATRAVEESALNAGIPLTKALLKAKSIRTLLPGVTGATQMQDIIPHEEDGGYVDQYLTEDEIDQYRKGGYIVEDISVPELNQAQKGGSKTHKSADGTVTNKYLNEDGDQVIQVKTKDGKYIEKIIPAAQQKAWNELGKKLTIPNQKIPGSMGEAQQMMDSGELDYETWNERKAKNQREAEAHKQERLNALAKNEVRYMDPRYSQLTGLPGESWRDKLANDVGATGAKFRVSQEDNFFDDYINPAVMIGSMAQSLGEAPKKAKESDSYMPYLTSIGSPLLAGAFAGIGAKNSKQFINNVVNPLAGLKAPKGVNQYIKGSKVVRNQAKNFKDKFSHLKDIKTVRALGESDPTIAKQMFDEYYDPTFGKSFNDSKDFRLSLKKSNRDLRQIKAQDPSFSFENPTSESDIYKLNRKNGVIDFNKKQTADKISLANKKKHHQYVEKKYLQNKDIVSQHPVFSKIAEESPQYLDIIAEQIKNPNPYISDESFLNSLVHKSNTFHRAMRSAPQTDDLLKVSGRSMSEGKNFTADVEGMRKSDDYGNNFYEYTPSEARMEQVRNAPMEEKWGLRIPQFENDISLNEGVWSGISPELYNAEKLNNQRYTNRVGRGVLAPHKTSSQGLLTKSEILPKKYVNYPKHMVFSSPTRDAQITGFDVRKVPYFKGNDLPGTSYGFKEGGMVVELTPEEIEDHIAQGYIVEDVKKPQMQSGGQLPYQIWEEKTGTPWAEAKKQGLTDGSYEQNIALAQKLVSGSAPVAAARPAFDNVKYDKIVNNMVNSGASLDELVAQQIGTREGLTKRYPNLFNKPAAEATAPVVKTNVKEPAKISKVTPGYMPWKAKAKAPKPKAKVEQPSHVIQDLRQRITPNIDQPRNGEKFIINKPQVKSKENYLENLKNFQSNFNAPNIIGAKGKQEPIANSPYANMDFSKAHDHPKLKLQSPKKEIIKPTPIPKFIPKPIVKPTPKPVIKSETEENVFDSIKNYTKNLFEGEQAEKKQPEEQPKVVKQDKEYATIDKLNTRLSSLDSTLQDAYYQYTNPKLSKEEKATATKNFKAKVAQRNQLINNINKQKENYAGGLDTWINNASPVAAKAAQKWGLSDQVSYSSYKLPDLETHVEKEEKENEKFRTSKRIDEISPKGSASSRWQFRVAASNDEPMKVQTYGTRAERPEDLKIKARGTVLHFLDQSPDSGYMHENTKDYYRNLKPDAYVGVLEKQKDGSKAVKYVQKKDIPAKDLFKNTFLVRQEKFDNIDFDTKVEDDNFSGHTYWTKKGTKKPTIPISSGKDPNVYDYSSGQSVVYIFPYKGKTRYVHFAGSPNAIRKEGEDIKKLYRLKNNTLNIGIADAGSYSSSIKGDVTDKKLKDRNYGYFNRNSFTGAGMALVE